MSISASSLEEEKQLLVRHVIAAGSVALIVFTASLFGILTRPVGFLAALWPANAILLGTMVRCPALNTIGGWVGAFAGYILADLITGGTIGVTLWLTLANMAGALTGVVLYQYLPEEDRRLGRPVSALFLFAICLVAAVAAGITGSGAVVTLFGRDLREGFEFWFVTELVNCLVILSVLLSLPAQGPQWRQRIANIRSCSVWRAAPVLALLISTLACVALGGPGAVAYAVPALLWCALTYSTFATAFLTMCFCSWLLIAISAGHVHVPMTDDLGAMSSLRLGIALVALGPLTAACINTARTTLVKELVHASRHDSLTGVLSRQAFLDIGAMLVNPRDDEKRSTGVLMLDIDNFKQINDTFGHAVGDRCLVRFAETTTATLRTKDILGRLGGEEFALVLPETTTQQAREIAERVRAEVERVGVHDADAPAITVSIGLAHTSEHPEAGVETMLGLADAALYEAKRRGRNRVETA